MIAVTASSSTEDASTRTLVNLRLRRRRRSFEKVEIAALVGLRDVLLIQRSVAALVLG